MAALCPAASLRGGWYGANHTNDPLMRMSWGTRTPRPGEDRVSGVAAPGPEAQTAAANHATHDAFLTSNG